MPTRRGGRKLGEVVELNTRKIGVPGKINIIPCQRKEKREAEKGKGRIPRLRKGEGKIGIGIEEEVIQWDYLILSRFG